jgi:flagellar biosynthesis chaperone FliJ
MPFRFSLAAVLRLRESRERTEEIALEQCYRQLYSIQKLLSVQDERIAGIRECYEQDLIKGTRAADLHCLLEQRFQAEHQREAILQQLAEAQEKLRQQIEIYRSARQQREIVAQVRAGRFRQHQQREALAEQKARDDLFLVSRQRPK